jgi:hypothetical protein
MVHNLQVVQIASVGLRNARACCLGRCHLVDEADPIAVASPRSRSAGAGAGTGAGARAGGGSMVLNLVHSSMCVRVTVSS